MEGDDCQEKNLVQVKVHGVEEGEISDSGSVEEISEEDFTKQSPAPPPPSQPEKSTSTVVNPNAKNNGLSGSGRVWTMRDMYQNNYRISSTTNYSGLYNLAWAQAVNNKPLDEVFVMMEDKSKESKVVIDVEDDGEKEEGEIEEGEIDLDSGAGVKNEGPDVMIVDESNESSETRKRIDVIKKELQGLNVAVAEHSFDRLCSSLKDLADRLTKLVPEVSSAEKETLLELLFTAIKNANSVYSSMNGKLKDRNRDSLTRLLTHVISLSPPLLSSLQLKEMEVIMSSATSLVESMNKEEESRIKHVDGGLSNIENAKKDSTSVVKDEVVAMDQEKLHSSLDYLNSGLVTSKQKGASLPLLDLHKDHDADSLPSPTREQSAPLPFDKGYAFSHGSFKPEWPVPRRTMGKTVPHPYDTDTVKAFSSYQQKFAQSSMYMKDELPSPTPSEEADVGDRDMNGEVSSFINRNVSSSVNVPSLNLPSSVNRNFSSTANVPSLGLPFVSAINSSISGQPAVSYSAAFNAVAGQGISRTGPNNNANPVSRPSSARSRDPRLRLANLDGGARTPNQGSLSGQTHDPIINLRKHKNAEELVLDGPTMKRQRNDSTGDMRAVTGTGGWLEDRGTVGIPVTSAIHMGNVSYPPRNSDQSVITSNMTSRGNNNSHIMGHFNSTLPHSTPSPTLPISSAMLPSVASNQPTSVLGSNLASNQSTSLLASNLPVNDLNVSTSFHSILKDIAVNPSMLMNFLKVELQRSSNHSKSVAESLNSNPTTKAPSASAVQIQVPAPTISPDESGKMRMKPRDPRRILHNNAAKVSSTAIPDQPKVNASSSSAMSGNLGTLKQNDHPEKSGIASTTKPPDITEEFTNNLRNIADILSVTQVSTASPIIPQNPLSQPVQGRQGGLEAKGVVAESGNLKKGAGLVPEQVTAGPVRPLKANAWSDVEHFFDGFDEQQKAAIQKERARRLEEQKKLFGVRKLCLVLDLDHTLLNSAKFGEVDQLHDDLLRKKEEQDRDKPHRHLFRFPHMSMWTKLRPGIWKFLEKASKLFEMHLYTMGNKYYATEMAKLLDPKGELFSGRVISRGDDGEPFDDDNVPKTKDLEGVLGMESSVVIIDDSIRVWPHNKLNLIAVERYIYFPCSRRQFGLPGPSLLEIDHDERPEDGTLASALGVIERIHQNFFAHGSLDEADVRDILASEQRKILGGCRIVFSRIFPVGEAKPHMHPLWQTAEQFGAVCTNQLDDQVTHVVAHSLGTDKVNWAISNGKFVVYPGWVEASALLYRRANEQDFAIKQ